MNYQIWLRKNHQGFIRLLVKGSIIIFSWEKTGLKWVNPFTHDVLKWPNILLKSCGVHTARFLKYVWPFYNIMRERVNGALVQQQKPIRHLYIILRVNAKWHKYFYPVFSTNRIDLADLSSLPHLAIGTCIWP